MRFQSVVSTGIKGVLLWEHKRRGPKPNIGVWVEGRVGFEETFPHVEYLYVYFVSDGA